jgi:hypothetical protein
MQDDDYPSIISPPDRDTAEEWVGGFLRSERNKVRHIGNISLTNACVALGHKSFRELAQKRIPEYSYSYLCKIRNAAELHSILEPDIQMGKIRESVLREAAKVTNKDRKMVWEQAKESAGAIDRLTARHIQEAARKIGATLKSSKNRHAAQNQNPSLDLESLISKLVETATAELKKGDLPSKKDLKQVLADLYQRLMESVYNQKSQK